MHTLLVCYFLIIAVSGRCHLLSRGVFSFDSKDCFL